MKNPKKIVFGLIILVAMVMSTCLGGRLWAQNPLDSLRKASPQLAKYIPPVPTPASFVADVAGVLSPEMHEVIDARIREAQGAQLGDIGAAILPDIGDQAPSQVALAIYRTWRIGRIAGIGDKQRDLGVLMLLVPKELNPNGKGECFILTGRGAEGIITDATAASICRDGIIPYMKERDYGAALLVGIDSISTRVANDLGLPGITGSALAESASAMTLTGTSGFDVPVQSSGGGDGWLKFGMGLGGVGLFGAGVRGAFYYRRTRKRRCARCGNDMQRLGETFEDKYLSPTQQFEEKIGSIDYDVWQCSCGETMLPLKYTKWLSGYEECSFCHVRACKSTRRTITPATYDSTGVAEVTRHCESCKKAQKSLVTIAKLTRSSSGSSSGGSSSSSSFGGSGSSSGGGGGSSY
ncbi:MAG: TPM domain-containing protein [Gemmatimonas sp.]